MKSKYACSSKSHSNVDAATAVGGDSTEERRKSSSPLRQKRCSRQTCAGPRHGRGVGEVARTGRAASKRKGEAASDEVKHASWRLEGGDEHGSGSHRGWDIQGGD